MTEHLIARLIYISGNEILLTFSKDGGYYFLPGGHIEDGETPEETLIREMKEEAGVTIDRAKIVRITKFENSWLNKKGKNHEICHIFKYNSDEKLETVSLEDHIEIIWKPLSSLKDLDIRPNQVLQFIE